MNSPVSVGGVLRLRLLAIGLVAHWDQYYAIHDEHWQDSSQVCAQLEP